MGDRTIDQRISTAPWPGSAPRDPECDLWLNPCDWWRWVEQTYRL